MSPDRIVVTAAQMQAIEARVFAAGMPVAALMEKVAGKIATRICQLYPRNRYSSVGVLVGPGHNGGDALVVARELHFQGYEVIVYQPFEQLKELTADHASYARSLGIPFHTEIEPLQACQLIIDGLFGFGLTREISGDLAAAIAQLNAFAIPIASLDLPSGVHTDTGEVLGTAIRASQTLCLGLWKRAFMQDRALEYLGKVERIDFDLPIADIHAIASQAPLIQRITPQIARQYLPLTRSPIAHKYRQGHLLLIAGSQQYAGSVILAALGARAAGVGMLTIAVPASLKPLLVAQVPEALVVACPETDRGAIAQLPFEVDLRRYDAVVFGPGLTLEPGMLVIEVLNAELPLVLDADGLNLLARQGVAETLQARAAPIVLTPHLGEFKRLFPAIDPLDRLQAAQKAAALGATVLFKGARTTIARPEGHLWVVPDSTAALARGGSGDVLAGLIGGLLAPLAARAAEITPDMVAQTVATAAWWHARAGVLAARDRTVLGVDPVTLAATLNAVLAETVKDTTGLGDN